MLTQRLVFCEGIEFDFFSLLVWAVRLWGMCVRGGAVCFLIFQIYILVLYVVRDSFLVNQ